MKNPEIITSVESKVSFPAEILGNSINNQLPGNILNESRNIQERSFSDRFANMDFCSSNVPLEGVVEIVFYTEEPRTVRCISVPVTTGFLVTCTKTGNEDYRIRWCFSLS